MLNGLVQDFMFTFFKHSLRNRIDSKVMCDRRVLRRIKQVFGVIV